MLVCVIMGSAVMLLGRYIREKALCRALQILCAVIIGVTVIGRLISGVHWFTDIIGGILIAKVALSFVVVVLNYVFSKLVIFKRDEADGKNPPAGGESDKKTG